MPPIRRRLNILVLNIDSANIMSHPNEITLPQTRKPMSEADQIRMAAFLSIRPTASLIPQNPTIRVMTKEEVDRLKEWSSMFAGENNDDAPICLNGRPSAEEYVFGADASKKE